jgi:transposase InsO family protein
LITLIQEAFVAGARLKRACEEASISFRTYKRWFKAGVVQTDKRPTCDRPAPANKLTPQEQTMILTTCNQAEYAHLPPSQIVPSLLDKGIYYASESSFYRVLKQAGQLNHRGRTSRSQKRHKPTSFKATKANELWSWDITYLASPVKGQYYYLYLFEDIYSRKIVGYEVHEKECGELASQLLQRCMLKEQCFNQPDSLVLHSDNGAPMKSLTLKAKMEELGIISSYSRPRVSNDNPYSESLFKTLKYRGNWPSNGFLSVEDARDWVHHFVDWYNNEHKHSQINYMTPANRHKGLDAEILSARKVVLEEARQANPLRWSGSVRNCDPVGAVMLNPDSEEVAPLKIAG